MSQLLNLLQGTFFGNSLSFYSCPSSSLMPLQCKPCLHNGKNVTSQRGNPLSLQGCWEVRHADTSSLPYQGKACDGAELDAFPHIQTLRKFPKEELHGKVVMVRFDSTVLLCEKLDQQSPSVNSALSTIKYLYNAGATVILVSNWTVKNNSNLLAVEYVAEFLSAVLQIKVAPEKLVSGVRRSKMGGAEKSDILLLDNLSQFREELANCSKFAEILSTGVDIFVNDAFSLSHRILSSTVGITRFCYACIAGLHFEEGLYQLKKAIKTNKSPYISIIGGGKLLEKATALRFLASRCDGLVFVGMMAFQIMHAQGLPVPMRLVEHEAIEDALNITQFAQFRGIPILFPKDFWCVNDCLPGQFKLFPSHSILDGWLPVDIGPKSLDEISSFLLKCEKILWIGQVKFCLSSQDARGASKLAGMLAKLNRRNCDITVVGNMACEALRRVSSSVSAQNMIDNASVMWEVLKGRNLPGLSALDRLGILPAYEAKLFNLDEENIYKNNLWRRTKIIGAMAYPFEIDWNATYADPARPLVVDIGSGNGLFLFGMARKRKDLNVLGLEINDKLVSRCLTSIHRSGMKNGYFITTNATSTFQSIVSSYPGKLILVSIQCPNPDFNKPEHRWSMLQRLLVEAIADLLASDGMVFLQSDVEAVAVRMKEQFVQYGKGKLIVMQDHADASLGGGWLKENPFGVRSDWEQHVIDRGAPMYRLMLLKQSAAG